MNFRYAKIKYLLYPEDRIKTYWDLFITIILIITCILAPWKIAFSKDSVEIMVISTLIDITFLIDMIIIFNSAYYNDEFVIVEDKH